MKSVAVMQPYLFPYLGYFQLVRHVDEFIFFDDVNYIKKGFINRNSILLDGEAHRFTLPVRAASQNRLINDHVFVEEVDDVISLLRLAYRKAPFFNDVFPIIEGTLRTRDRTVSILAANSIINVFAYLGLSKCFSFSSSVNKLKDVKGEQKIIEICVLKGATRYANAIGGRELYSSSSFRVHGIELEFVQMQPVVYSQGRDVFVPNLSIIDVLMNCSKQQIEDFLSQYVIELGSDAAPQAAPQVG